MNNNYLYKNKSSSELILIQNKSHLKQDKLKTFFVNNGVLDLSFGVYDDEKQYVKFELYSNGDIKYDIDFINEDLKEKIKINKQSDETVFFIGAVRGHWGSFFIDDISRLWYLLENKATDIKLAYCGKPLSDIQYKLLGYLGVNNNILRITETTQFKQIIIAEKSFVCDKFYTENYKTIYSHIAGNIQLSIPKYDKIYFTRSQLSIRKEVGENYFEQVFANNGFKIIAPEKLSLEEQIYLTKNCKILASIEGTLAHNIVWASNNITQIILRKQSEIIPRQILLNQMISNKVVFVDVYYEPLLGFPINHDDGPFLLLSNKNFMRFSADFKLSTLHVPSKIFMSYIQYFLKCLSVFLRYILTRLYIMLPDFVTIYWKKLKKNNNISHIKI